MTKDEDDALYDEFAAHYHLIYEDWDAAITRQGTVLYHLIRAEGFAPPARILDCTCGVGTQALGLAGLGYKLSGSDVSAPAINRARAEAGWRNLDVTFQVSDVRGLSDSFPDPFDVVLSADNALPHLPSEDDILKALAEMAGRLRPGGLLVISIRDYDNAVFERPVITQPRFFKSSGCTRFVHQVWEWLDDRSYRMHLYLTEEIDEGWVCRHFVGRYRAVLRLDLTDMLKVVGLVRGRWIMPSDSGFHQPILVAHKPERAGQ